MLLECLLISEVTLGIWTGLMSAILFDLSLCWDSLFFRVMSLMLEAESMALLKTLSLIISMLVGIASGFFKDRGSLCSCNRNSRLYCNFPSGLFADHCSDL